jgi:hypothetical protein
MKRVTFFFGCILFLAGKMYAAKELAQSKNHLGNQKEKTEIKTTDPEPNVNGVVEVSFKIDAAGKVQVMSMNATSPQLAEYVMQKLNKIQLQQVSAELGKIIHYRFVFKKQA